MCFWRTLTGAGLTLAATLGLPLLSIAQVSSSPTQPFTEPQPEATKKVAPVYPDDAREAGVRGTVSVLALVGSNGRVQETHVHHSVPRLDAAAVNALRQWMFTPALANGRPVAVWVEVPFRFGPGDWSTENDEHSISASMNWAVVVRPDSTLSTRERIAFYVNRLGDSTYIEYSYDGEPRSWVVAPEELGLIGAPALPSLIQALSASSDTYERTQIFYALLLAAQGPGTEDRAAQAELRVLCTRFPEAFPPESQHAALKQAWLRWWKNNRAHISVSAKP